MELLEKPGIDLMAKFDNYISAIIKMAEKICRPILTNADECHRSIYNVWSQVLEYFDSFIIGLTATPDKSKRKIASTFPE